MGDIDERTADELAAELALISHPPFVLRLSGLGYFGSREPKVIWAGLAASAELDQLQRLNDRAARAVGLAADTHSFKPHVTLARLRGVRSGQVARYLEEAGHFASEPFSVERFVLMSAKPGTGGGPYVIEETYPLDAGQHDDAYEDEETAP